LLLGATMRSTRIAENQKNQCLHIALAKISNNTNDGLRVETMNTPISPPTSAATRSDMTTVVGTTNQTSSLTTGTRIKTLIPPLNMVRKPSQEASFRKI